MNSPNLCMNRRASASCKIALTFALVAASLVTAGCQVEQISPPADVAAPAEDAMTTQSGLAHKVIVAGEGASPGPESTVRVHYTGWTTDGKTFDSSVSGGVPLVFPLKAVISGWTEGLQLMKEGGKRRLWIPEALAYKGQVGKPAGMLVFDVELIDVLP